MTEESQSKQKYYESNAGDGSKATDQHLTGIKLAVTLLSLVLGLFASALDQTIVSTILTQVGSEFGSFDKVGWLTSAYLLPMATLSPSYGKISIAFGRKYTMLAGLGFFMVGSLISALATSMDMLIGGRIIQGIGGGAISAMVMVIISEVVPMSLRSLAMTLIGMTFSVASAVGPFIGGSFASKVTWRWCFYINLPVGGVGFVALFFAFNPPRPEGNVKAKLAKIDYIGTFLVTSGLILILLALTFGGNSFPWHSSAVILCFVLGGLLVIGFGVYNFMYSPNPIVIKQAITNPHILVSSLAGFFSFAQFMVNIVFLAIYFQVIHNASAWQSGVDLLPFVITVSLSAVFNGFFMKFTRYVKITFVICGVTSIIGSGLLLLFDLEIGLGLHFGVLIVNGIAAGLSFQCVLLSAQLCTPKDIPGSLIVITSFINFCKSLGGVLGIALGQVILQTSIHKNIKTVLDSLDPNSSDYQILSSVSSTSIATNPTVISSFPSSLRHKVLVTFMDSLREVFYFSIALSAVLLILTLFTTNRRIPKHEDVRKKGDDSVGDEIREVTDEQNRSQDSEKAEPEQSEGEGEFKPKSSY